MNLFIEAAKVIEETPIEETQSILPLWFNSKVEFQEFLQMLKETLSGTSNNIDDTIKVIMGLMLHGWVMHSVFDEKVRNN